MVAAQQPTATRVLRLLLLRLRHALQLLLGAQRNIVAHFKTRAPSQSCVGLARAGMRGGVR